MRKIRAVLIVLLVFFTMQSCEKEDPLVVRKVTDDFLTTISLGPEDIVSNENSLFSDSATLDIAVNDEIAGFEDLILDARINYLTYEITNFSGTTNETLSDASLIINGIRVDLGDINLQSSDNDNVIFRVDDRYILNQMSTLFMGSTSGLAVLSTKLNNNDSSFDLRIAMNLSIVIDSPQ